MMTRSSPLNYQKKKGARERKERRYEGKKRTTQAGIFRPTQEVVRKQIPSLPEPRVLSIPTSLSLLTLPDQKGLSSVKIERSMGKAAVKGEGSFAHPDRRDGEVFTMRTS